MLFELRDIGMRYGEREVLRGVNLTFSAGELVAIAGPNGAGKSTLIGVMSGLRPAASGECRFDGRDVRSWPRRAFARSVSVVPQVVRAEFPFTAEQVVLMGRTPHGDGMFESSDDRAAVERALEMTDTKQFRRRDFRSLSGGESQRVVVAAALAQSPRALLMDEPTAFLDLEHQIALYRMLRRLCASGLLAVTVTHDLNLAAAYADRLVLLKGGAVMADGVPASVLRSGILRDVFAVEVEVLEVSGRTWILYGG